MRKIVVVGSSNTDMVVRTPKIPIPGETILGGEFNIIQGGKGANQAVAAARAGANVSFIAKVGNDDFGKQAIEGYDRDNIDIKSIYIDDKSPTGTAIIIVDEMSGENSIVVASGANNNLSIDDISTSKNLIKNSDVLLIQLEIPLETAYAALRIAKSNNVTTILNPAPAQHLSDEMLQLVDIITPNESELNLLLGIAPNEFHDIENLAKKLLSKVAHTVIVTLGNKGVFFVSKNVAGEFVSSNKVKAIDTTAAGDTFNGYLASALAKGKSLIDSIQLANKAAALSVTRKGAQPSIPTINELLK